MGVKRGLDLKLYYNSATYASPTWVLIDLARDVNLDFTADEGDSSSRLSEIGTSEPTTKKLSIDFEMINDTANSAIAAMDTRFLANTLTEFAFADGPIATTGTKYRRLETKLFGAGEGQPLGGVSTRKFVAKPCYSTNTQWAQTTVA
jgi:hypothetical protein